MNNERLVSAPYAGRQYAVLRNIGSLNAAAIAAHFKARSVPDPTQIWVHNSMAIITIDNKATISALYYLPRTWTLDWMHRKSSTGNRKYRSIQQKRAELRVSEPACKAEAKVNVRTMFWRTLAELLPFPKELVMLCWEFAALAPATTFRPELPGLVFDAEGRIAAIKSTQNEYAPEPCDLPTLGSLIDLEPTNGNYWTIEIHHGLTNRFEVGIGSANYDGYTRDWEIDRPHIYGGTRLWIAEDGNVYKRKVSDGSVQFYVIPMFDVRIDSSPITTITVEWDLVRSAVRFHHNGQCRSNSWIQVPKLYEFQLWAAIWKPDSKVRISERW